LSQAPILILRRRREQIHNHKTDDRELVFAVAHTWEMLAKLKRDYYATYHNEKPGGLHTSSI
jgi:hypothetical protein